MLTVRHIKTKTVPVLDEEQNPVVQDGKPVTQIVPDLDAHGNEIELWSVTVPADIEAEGGAAIDAFVAAELAKQAAADAPATPSEASTNG